MINKTWRLGKVNSVLCSDDYNKHAVIMRWLQRPVFTALTYLTIICTKVCRTTNKIDVYWNLWNNSEMYEERVLWRVSFILCNKNNHYYIECILILWSMLFITIFCFSFVRSNNDSWCQKNWKRQWGFGKIL